MDSINPERLKPVEKKDSTKEIVESLTKIRSSLLQIKKTTIFSLSTKKKTVVVNKTDAQKSERITTENKRESFRPRFKLPSITFPNFSGLSIIEKIKTFAMNLLMGFLFVRMFKYLPELLNITKKILPIAFFIEELIGKMLNGVISFIDFSYTKFDSLRSLSKTMGGEKFEKIFDSFTSALNKYLNLIFLGGLALAGSMGSVGILRRSSKSGALFGKIPKERITPKTKSGPNITGDIVQETESTLGKRAVAKGASRIITKGFFVVGPLIDFAIRTLVFKEPADRAAVGAISTAIGQAIGASLGGIIGGLAGSVVPIVGNLLAGGAGIFLGGLIGGFIGDWLGSSLYDYIKGSQEKPGTIQKRAEGGQITRQGIPVGGDIKRTIKKVRKSPIKSTPKKPLSGRDVGGLKKIKTLFASPDDPKKKNPLKTLEFAAYRFSKDPLFGPLIGAGVSAAIGQRPEKSMFKMVANNFGILIQNMLDGYIDMKSNTLTTNLLAMAEGGLVPRTGGLEEISFGKKFTELLSKSFDIMMNNSVNDIFQNILKQYPLEDFGGSDILPLSEQPSDSGSAADFDISGNANDPVSGALLLMQSGLPAKSAAYLSGNIMQESQWKGQRDPWVISSDGAGTNKGIMSWNRDRITRAEQFLGKPLQKSSNAEQVRFVLYEMQKYYPDSWTVLNNNNSSIEQIKNALYRYTGWGHLGSRWTYAETALRGLEQRKIDSNSRMTPNILNLPSGPSQNIGMIFKTNTKENQYYGAPRPGRKHAGQDIQMSPTSRQITYLGGKVIDIQRHVNSSGEEYGYGLYVDILTPTGKVERLAELGKLDKKVFIGATLSPGQVVSYGAGFSGVTHLEYRTRGTTGEAGSVDPLKYLRSLGAISGNDTFTYRGINKGSSSVSTNVPIGENKVSADIKEFRKFRTSLGGSSTRNPTSSAQNFQIREMGTFGSGNYNISPLADDTSYEINVHEGEGHWDNRAFDIPVPNLAAGDKVAKFWKDRGYKVLWRVKDHFNHVHVEVPKNKVKEFFTINRRLRSSLNNSTNLVSMGSPATVISSPRNITMPQSVSRWDVSSLPSVERITIATQIIEKNVPIPTQVPVAVPLFPGESNGVNIDIQRQAMVIG